MKHLTSASLSIALVLVFASCKKDIDKEFQQPEMAGPAIKNTTDIRRQHLYHERQQVFCLNRMIIENKKVEYILI